MKNKFIIVRYNIKNKERTAQYYSTNAAQNSHFWSFNDNHAKVFSSLQQARDAESFAYDEQFMTSVFEFNDALKMPLDRDIWLYSELLQNAQECGLKNYY